MATKKANALKKLIQTKNNCKPFGEVRMPRGATHTNRKTAYNRQMQKNLCKEF